MLPSDKEHNAGSIECTRGVSSLSKIKLDDKSSYFFRIVARNTHKAFIKKTLFNLKALHYYSLVNWYLARALC